MPRERLGHRFEQLAFGWLQGISQAGKGCQRLSQQDHALHQAGYALHWVFAWSRWPKRLHVANVRSLMLVY